MGELNLSIIKLSEWDNKAKADAIQIFIDCFPVYERISKNKNILNDFFMSSFDFSLSYVAVVEAKVVGFLAISNGRERSLKFNKSSLESEKDVGIDHLATDKLYRGKGIASKLIEYACVNLCYKECFLDVDTNNAVANALLVRV